MDPIANLGYKSIQIVTVDWIAARVSENRTKRVSSPQMPPINLANNWKQVSAILQFLEKFPKASDPG
jgi:hypothetical protein